MSLTSAQLVCEDATKTKFRVYTLHNVFTTKHAPQWFVYKLIARAIPTKHLSMLTESCKLLLILANQPLRRNFIYLPYWKVEGFAVNNFSITQCPIKIYLHFSKM